MVTAGIVILTLLVVAFVLLSFVASQLASRVGARLIDPILSAALVSGRRVRRETKLGRHPASVGSAAVDVAGSVTPLESARVLMIGAGEVAEGVLRALQGRTAGTAVFDRPGGPKPVRLTEIGRASCRARV